jgi:2,5-diketo-D-gluconate reductase A
MLRWLVQRAVVVIPKSVRRERMAQNLKVFDFTLAPGEMKAIERLDTGASLFLDHRDPATVKWLGELRLAGRCVRARKRQERRMDGGDQR